LNKPVYVNKKLDKFLDIGYFLLYPTIYDDPEKPFQVLNQVEPNVRTALRTMLNNGPKILAEIKDYVGILATASNDNIMFDWLDDEVRERFYSAIIETLKSKNTFSS